MRTALDSNILIYAEEINQSRKGDDARALIDRLHFTNTTVAVQALGEVFNVLTRKAGLSRPEAQTRVQRWGELFNTVATSNTVLADAIELAVWSQLRIWDAVHLAVAAGAGCEVFLSEDLQHGFRWRGVTVVNPFAHPDHPLLARLRERA